MRSSSCAGAIFLLTALIAGCRHVAPEQPVPARPVTYLVLQELNPSRLSRVTGSVESWKKEMLSFRVSGRVLDVVEPGVEIQGRLFNADGEVSSPGTLLAELDDDIYELKLAEAEAAVNAATAQVTLAQTELERTVPERIKAAAAELDQKKAEFQRLSSLVSSKAISKSDFDIGQSEFRQAQALLAATLAEQATKTAELSALAARVAESEQARRQADINLQDCQLYSPFTGQVSKVHAIAGSYLYEGMPIVTVQLMDPVKVEVAVSGETDQRLHYNDQVKVRVDNWKEPLGGYVYLKDTVADAATRTFNVTILVRNRLIATGIPSELAAENLPRTTDLYVAESEKADGLPPFYADERSIHTDQEGRPFVWKVQELTAGDLSKDFNPVFTVKRVYVELGEKTLPVLQLYKGRQLADLGGLNAAHDLMTGRLPDSVRDGDRVLLSRNQWLLRPGQLAHVELKGRSVQPGFYVPRRVVLRESSHSYVFVAQDSDSGKETAKRVPVNLSDEWGDLVRVEPLDGAFVAGTTRLVCDGAHYLQNGDAINAFEEVEPLP